jgi:putative oxidoreductase
MFGRIQDLTALIGRVAVAAVFLAYGLDKWNNGVQGTAEMFDMIGVPLPTVAAVFTIAVEVVGSLAFIAGLAMPLVGIGYAVVGLGAMVIVHLDAGLTGDGGYGLVLVLALAGLALGFNGGRFSLDHLLLGRRTAAERVSVSS